MFKNKAVYEIEVNNRVCVIEVPVEMSKGEFFDAMCQAYKFAIQLVKDEEKSMVCNEQEVKLPEI